MMILGLDTRHCPINLIARIPFSKCLCRISFTVVMAATLAPNAFSDRLADPLPPLSREIPERTEGTPDIRGIRVAGLQDPAREWQGRALDAISRSPSPETPREDFLLLAQGVHARPGGRALATEFLAELPDARLTALYQEAQRDRDPSIARAEARLKAAESILARPSISELHPEVAYERARLLLVTGRPRSEVLAALTLSEETAARAPEVAARSKAATAALTNPQVAADYAASIELIDLATQYWARRQSTALASLTVKQLQNQGVAHFHPARFGGDATPLRAAARVSFELDHPAFLDELLKVAEGASVSDENIVEIRYWTAMCAYANRDYQKAIFLFEQNMVSGVQSKYAAESTYEAAQSCILIHQFSKAAVLLWDVTETKQSFPDVVSKAQHSFDFLMESGKLDDATFQAALASYLPTHDLAMISNPQAQ